LESRIERIYLFQEGVPSDFQTDYDKGIFHQPQHLLLQAPGGWHSFSLVNTRTNTLCAEVHFHIESGVAKSPYRSPFGSFLFSNNLPDATLMEFIQRTEESLLEKGARNVVIKNPPEAHNAVMIQRLEHALLVMGYGVEEDEVSAIIPVTGDSFEKQIHRSEMKKLRKCREQDVIFTELPLSHLPNVYSFLQACREQKGYSLSMTLDALETTILKFPTSFILTTVLLRDQMVAGNISIMVNSKVLYNFYHDHAKEHDWLSPVVLLNEGLYIYCQRNHFKLLDLGTSSAKGSINQSLLTFKLRLGATPSPKRSFRKELN
jgi:hypothetical protein